MRYFRRAPYLVIEWQDEGLVLLNCDTLRRFHIDHSLLTILSLLTRWTSLEEIRKAGHLLATTDLERLRDLGVVEQSNAPVQSSGHDTTYWTSFELAVQRNTNIGGMRPAASLLAQGPPPAAFKPPRDALPLSLPDPSSELPDTLGSALVRRRSVRTYADRSLSLEELSELLYYSARIVSTAGSEHLGDHAFRLFPSGGARAELELYVAANDVAGLKAGAHYYDARQHCLFPIRTSDEHQRRLNQYLHRATGGTISRDPPLIIIITAVFARVMWKYSGVGLSVIYKNVGCLYQTLYLVATALGLAPCGIGGSEEVANSRWLGLDPLVESQVGCFIVGPRPESAQARPRHPDPSPPRLK